MGERRIVHGHGDAVLEPCLQGSAMLVVAGYQERRWVRSLSLPPDRDESASVRVHGFTWAHPARSTTPSCLWAPFMRQPVASPSSDSVVAHCPPLTTDA